LSAGRQEAVRGRAGGRRGGALGPDLAGCGAAVVRGLIGLGLVEERLISGEAPPAGKLRDRVAEGGFSVTVLDGVTGSSSFLSAPFITCGIAAFIPERPLTRQFPT